MCLYILSVYVCVCVFVCLCACAFAREFACLPAGLIDCLLDSLLDSSLVCLLARVCVRLRVCFCVCWFCVCVCACACSFCVCVCVCVFSGDFSFKRLASFRKEATRGPKILRREACAGNAGDRYFRRVGEVRQYFPRYCLDPEEGWKMRLRAALTERALVEA